MSDDHRTGRRRVDVTLGLHLDGDDVEIATEAITNAIKKTLEGITIRGGLRKPFVIDHVDDPIHVHSMRQGPLVPTDDREVDLDFSHPDDPNR